MKNYLNEIIEKHEIRRTKEEKQAFIEYVKKEFNDRVVVETNNKNHNIIIGHIEDAKVIFTAHYDTPATSLLPNLMLPKNKILGLVYQFGYPFSIAMVALLITYIPKIYFGLSNFIWIISYLVVYFGMFYLCTKTFKNKKNSNDNTSGVSTVLALAASNLKNSAFLLFDNEEKGLLGSKAYSKQHKELLKDKLLINLDCVGNGNNLIVISKKQARTLKIYESLQETMISDENYNVLYLPLEKSLSNSDHKNFVNGVCIVACKKSKHHLLYTPRIHTNRDIIANEENIIFLVNKLSEFTKKI